MKELLGFLDKQKALVISLAGESPWAFTVYFASNSQSHLYFVTAHEAFHSKHIQDNPRVAFATFWHDESDLGDRKGLQGVGKCEVITDKAELERAIKAYNDKYPDSKSSLSIEAMLDPGARKGLYKIVPSFIKHWDDKAYGESKIKEFNF